MSRRDHRKDLPMATDNGLYRLMLRRWWLALLMMGTSFVLFGLASMDLFATARANFQFFARHGMEAVREGGVIELLEIALDGYLAAGFYVVFKACEKALVHRLTTTKIRHEDRSSPG